MTETQAKSGAAGADLDPTHGSARPATEASAEPVTDTPETPAATEHGAGDPAPNETSASTVIRRPSTAAPFAAAAPSAEAKDAREASDAKAESTDSSPTRSAPLVPESSPTTRLSAVEAAAHAESAVRAAPGGRVGATSSSTSSGGTSSSGTGTVGRPASTSPVGRATVPVAPGTSTRGGRSTSSDASPARTAAGAVTAAAAVGAARVSETLRTARATVAGAASRGPRRARLHLKRIDPWSVMKFSFAVSLVLFVVGIVATSVLYLALDAMNVFDSVNKAVAEITGQSGAEATGFRITAKGVIGTSVLLGAVNMVLFTALATLGAFVYNVCADLVGGIELTLSEKE
jgi:hypothetical protein